MKKFEKIEDVKPGDKFKLQFGFSVDIAKCLHNDPERKRIHFSLRCFFGLLPFGVSEIKDYSGYNFRDFKMLNQ